MTDLNPYLIERAAKALWDEPGWEQASHEQRQHHREAAERALSAVLPNIIKQAKTEALAEGDGYHTHEELYEYRMLYNAHAARGWLAAGIPVVKSWRHSDGALCFGGGWFVVTATLPSGQVSNHYKAEFWDMFDVPEVDLAPEYDGHTPAEAAERLRASLEAAAPDIIKQAKAEAWDEGAHTAWERSTPEVNGARYHWRHDGEPVNPYEADAGAERGHDETRLDLEPIKARVAAATDGPWSGVKDGTYRVFTPSGQIVAYSMNAANREFVQHAREDVPALITEIESLRATIERKEQP